MSARLNDLVVISGFSGAGKSSAMNVFDDAGYFCVDNLPPGMIRSLAGLFLHEGSKVERACVVSDLRAGDYFARLAAVLDELDGDGVANRVLFLQADEQTLLTRYKETRRRHPLARNGNVADGVRREQELLAPIRERADCIIDTTGLSPVVSMTVSARSRIGASSACSRWIPSATLPLRACGWRRRVSL